MNPATLAENVTENIRRIFDGDNEFRLRAPISLKRGRSGPYITLEYPPLNLLAWGKTETEALGNFAYQFGGIWEQLSECRESELTQQALKLKRAMDNLVESVAAA